MGVIDSNALSYWLLFYFLFTVHAGHPFRTLTLWARQRRWLLTTRERTSYPVCWRRLTTRVTRFGGTCTTSWKFRTSTCSFVASRFSKSSNWTRIVVVLTRSVTGGPRLTRCSPSSRTSCWCTHARRQRRTDTSTVWSSHGRSAFPGTQRTICFHRRAPRLLVRAI